MKAIDSGPTETSYGSVLNHLKTNLVTFHQAVSIDTPKYLDFYTKRRTS